MNFKDIQTELKTLGIKKTIQEISDFLAQNNLSLDTAVLENVLALFQKAQQQTALSNAPQSRKLTAREKKTLEKFQQKPQEIPQEQSTHNSFHDINDSTFQTAVDLVAGQNFQKAVVFPQAVASRTHELLSDPENQQILQTSLEDASTKIEQMLYGFNPTAVME